MESERCGLCDHYFSAKQEDIIQSILVLMILTTMPAAVGSVQRMKSVVTLPGLSPFRSGSRYIFQGSVPPCQSVCRVLCMLPRSQGQICPASLGYRNRRPYLIAFLAVPQIHPGTDAVLFKRIRDKRSCRLF